MVQDAVVKAWTKIDTFEEGTNMRAWLFTILRNTFYSHHRKARREISDSEGELSGNLAQKPDHDGRLQMRDFNKAFEKLTVEQREALTLVGAGGFSYEEAAETCGVAVGTIKSRVNRARARLAELLELDEDEAIEATDVVTSGVVAANQKIA